MADSSAADNGAGSSGAQCSGSVVLSSNGRSVHQVIRVVICAWYEMGACVLRARWVRGGFKRIKGLVCVYRRAQRVLAGVCVCVLRVTVTAAATTMTAAATTMTAAATTVTAAATTMTASATTATAAVCVRTPAMHTHDSHDWRDGRGGEGERDVSRESVRASPWERVRK